MSKYLVCRGNDYYTDGNSVCIVEHIDMMPTNTLPAEYPDEGKCYRTARGAAAVALSISFRWSVDTGMFVNIRVPGQEFEYEPQRAMHIQRLLTWAYYADEGDVNL